MQRLSKYDLTLVSINFGSFPVCINEEQYENYLFIYFCRSRNAIGRQVQQIQLQQPQFVQVEVADVDNQQFIVYAD